MWRSLGLIFLFLGLEIIRAHCEAILAAKVGQLHIKRQFGVENLLLFLFWSISTMHSV
jgi:hypothetical protein